MLEQGKTLRALIIGPKIVKSQEETYRSAMLVSATSFESIPTTYFLNR